MLLWVAKSQDTSDGLNGQEKRFDWKTVRPFGRHGIQGKMGSDRATGGPTPASAAGLHDCLWRLRHNRDSAAKALCPCFSTSGTGAQGPMAQCCHQFQVGGQRHRPGHGPGDCPESQADPTGREDLVEKGRMDFASVCSTCHNQTP